MGQSSHKQQLDVRKIKMAKVKFFLILFCLPKKETKKGTTSNDVPPRETHWPTLQESVFHRLQIRQDKIIVMG